MKTTVTCYKFGKNIEIAGLFEKDRGSQVISGLMNR
jgi:hypothetical protein